MRTFLAIDKPPGLVVHPTHSHLRNTVITLLGRQRTGEPELDPAHRLDAETSGVLLLGRNRDAARRIQLSFNAVKGLSGGRFGLPSGVTS